MVNRCGPTTATLGGDPAPLTAPICGALDGGTPVTFPAVLENDQVALLFDADLDFGVRLVSILDRHGPAEFPWLNLPPLDRGADHRLWEIRGRLHSGFSAGFDPGFGGTYSVTGTDAASFEARRSTWHSGEPALFFIWSGVQVPGADDCATLRVFVSVVLGPDDNSSRWWIAVIPEDVVGQFSIDEVDLGRTWWKGPVEPTDLPNHIHAQARARLIIPINALEASHTSSQNSSFSLWVNPFGEVESELGHPHGAIEGRHQTLQFAALAGGDPADPASFRRILMLGSEDGAGHFKRFKYEGKRTAGFSEARLGWRHTYLPPWFRSEFDVEFHAAYPVTIGAILAPTDALWFAAAREYRRFVRRGIGGLRKEARGGPSLITGDPYVALISAAFREPEYLLYERFVAKTETIRNMLRNDRWEPAHIYVQWQNWARLGDQGSLVDNPSSDIEGSIDTGVLAAMERGTLLGQRIAVYNQPRILSASAGFAVPADALVVSRVPSADPLDALSLVFDFGTLAGQRWWAENVAAPLAALLPLGGLYVNGVSGGYSKLSYPPVVDLTTHLQHGGPYFVQGKRELFRLVREAIAAASPFRTICSPNDTDAFVVSEAAEEFIHHELSLSQEGYIFVPGLLQFAEPTVFGESEMFGGLGDAAAIIQPSQVRHMSPPMWTAVYSAFAANTRLVMPLSNAHLATNSAFHPLDGYQGMTSEEMVDVFCFLFALTTSAGLKTAYSYAMDFDSPLFSAAADGTLSVDASRDPDGAGIVVGEFLRVLFAAQERAFAGRFLTLGSLELPPPVADDSPELVLVENPLVACRRTHPAHAPATYPSYNGFFPTGFAPGFDLGFSGAFLTGWPWQVLPFVVHQVLASAWLSPEGVPGLVLINWGRSPATWAGTWEPSEYGMSEVDSYTVAVETIESPPLVSPFGPASGAAEEDCEPMAGGAITQDWTSDTQLGAALMDWISDARLGAATTHDRDWTSDTLLGAAGTEIQSWTSDTRLGVATPHTQDWLSLTRLAAETPMSHTGTLIIHARGTSGAIVQGNVDIGTLPPHSVTVVTFPSIGPRVGSGFSNGFSSGFGGSQAPFVVPTSFSPGFSQGFF